MIKGFAYIAWQIENQPFAEAHAATPRYLAQEVEHLLRGAQGEGGRRPDEVSK